MKEKTKDIIVRAMKTFIQAFAASISVDSLISATDKDAIVRVGTSMLIAGVSAGVSAVWNFIQKTVNTICKEEV
ncbi:MAG: hypothetical protein HFG28_10385 [Eubacterium sp.]|nr:hypothetical protein [Eubacterium sp.]